MIRRCFLIVGIAWAATILGCGSSVKEEQIQVKKAPSAEGGLAQATTLLERYAKGQPMTSEAASFPGMVERVRKEDSAKADILEAGLADLQKAPPGARAAKAKAILDKLQTAKK